MYNGLVNIIPFWSTNIIQLYGLGNEYSVPLNLILTELLKISTLNFNDTIWLISVFVIFVCLSCIKFGLLTNFNFFDKNTICIYGKETETPTGKILVYCDKIEAINNYLINIKKYNNITFVNDYNIIINNVNNYYISKNIYLTITRVSNDQQSKVTYTLWSYYNNILNDFLEKILTEHKYKNKNELVLIGNETDNLLNYPLPILAINKWVSHKYNFPKLKCLKHGKVVIPNENDDKDCINNEINNDEYSYTLDNIDNFQLDEIILTIKRENNYVYYYLKSTTVCCKEWLENKIQFYNQNKDKFKNKVVLSGQECIYYTQTNYKKYYYSNYMWALNWYSIDILKHQNYECTDDNYILEPIDMFKIENDIYLSITKNSQPSNMYGNKEKNIDFNVTYTLQSNNDNIKSLLDDILDKYIKYTKNKQKDKNNIIYHFVYSGLKNNELTFQKKILSEKGTLNELFETFDKIHNEHVPIIKKDIDKLRDIEYYKTHGLKRKKGYLFHGLPGCGKTSMVVAMALYDNRHIVEIPFSLITKNDEFDKLMHLTTINGIEINNNNIIILFDEIDIGMENIGSRKNITTDPNIALIESLGKIVDGCISSEESPSKINLGTLLSKLDGIGNYNGLIMVGTTNCIDKLDPALYRELRLTPYEFRKLRKIDCKNIIENYFGKVEDELFEKLKDNVLTPVKLITMCQKYDNVSINEFFDYLIDFIEKN